MRATGLRPRRVGVRLALAAYTVLPSALRNNVGTRDWWISRLNTVPAHAPVNASPPPSRTTTHDSPRGRVPWAALLARVFTLDLSRCPKCHGPLRMLDAVTDPDKIAVNLIFETERR